MRIILSSIPLPHFSVKWLGCIDTGWWNDQHTAIKVLILEFLRVLLFYQNCCKFAVLSKVTVNFSATIRTTTYYSSSVQTKENLKMIPITLFSTTHVMMGRYIIYLFTYQSVQISYMYMYIEWLWCGKSWIQSCPKAYIVITYFYNMPMDILKQRLIQRLLISIAVFQSDRPCMLL